MASPTFIIEAAFGSSPLGARVWTDITDAVRSMTLHRGKNHELGQAEPGTAKFKILNNDRRFDPSNTSSTFSPNVALRTPIRARVTYNAVTYDVWLGFVKRWYPTWNDGVRSDTIVEASGILAFVTGLRGGVLPSSAWEMVIRQTPNKRSWWRFEEQTGATLAIDQMGLYHLTYEGTPTLGVSGLVTGSDNTAVNFAATGSASISDVNAALTGADFTVVGIFSRGFGTSVEYLAGQAFSVGGGASPYGWWIDLQPNSGGAPGQLHFQHNNSAGTGEVYSSTRYDDNIAHDFVAVKQGAAITLYVDGVNVGTAAVSAAGLPAAKLYVAQPIDPVFGLTALFSGVLDELVTFDGALSAADALALHNARLAWPNETTGTRMLHTLDYLGITAADRAIDAGTTILQPETNLGTDPFTYLDSLRHAENGELFEAGDGTLTFHSRQHRMIAPFNVSQATFSNLNGATNPIKAGGLAAPLDLQDVYNDIPVSRTNGVSYRAVDDASQLANGTLPLSGYENLPIASDLEVVDAANWLLNRYKTARQRIDQLTVAPYGKDATLFPQALGREIGDRITISHQPPGGGPAFTGDFIIEAVDHDISVDGTKKFDTTFATSYADTTLYLVFDDAVSGKFDTGVFAY